MTHAHTLCFYKVPKILPKTQNQKPKNFWFWKFCFSELTVTGRPARSTDVHNTVHVYISRPTRSTDVHLLSQEFSVDRPGRPMNPNGHIFDRWRSTDPVDRTLSKVLTDPTAIFSDCFSFWDLIPTNLLGCF